MSSLPKSGPGGPSRPVTHVIYSHNKLKGEFLFVEDEPNRGAWIEVDDQHVYPLEAME